MTSQDEFSFGKTLFHPETTYFTHKTDFSDKVQIPKWAPFAPNGTANQIAGYPGTTVVSIGHLTTWPENPGYRTQVWDKVKYPSFNTWISLKIMGMGWQMRSFCLLCRIPALSWLSCYKVGAPQWIARNIHLCKYTCVYINMNSYNLPI